MSSVNDSLDGFIELKLSKCEADSWDRRIDFAISTNREKCFSTTRVRIEDTSCWGCYSSNNDKFVLETILSVLNTYQISVVGKSEKSGKKSATFFVPACLL